MEEITRRAATTSPAVLDAVVMVERRRDRPAPPSSGIASESHTTDAEMSLPLTDLIEANRALRAELADRARIERELQARLEFEELLSRLSTELMQACDDDIFEPLRSALAHIQAFLGADRAELRKGLDDGEFHLLMSVGEEEMGDDAPLRVGDRSIASAWYWTHMAAGRVIAVRSIADLPATAGAERFRMERWGVESMLVAPLRVGESLIGMLTLETYRTCHIWPPEKMGQIQLLSRMLAGAIHRQKIRRKLAESEARFRSLVEGQEEFIVRWAPNGKITFASATWRRYMGIGENDPIQASFWDNIDENERRRVEEALADLGYWNTTVEEEHAVTHPDGSPGWRQWTHRTVANADGELIEYQSVGRDVTRRKQAEIALQEQRSMLAHATRLATMSEMVGGISHEVNQPLYAIKNFGSAILKMLDQKPVDMSLVREWAEMISTSAEKAGEIIRRLREFLSGKQVEWQTVKIAELVQGAVDMIGFDLTKHQIRLRKKVEPHSASVEADGVQLQQVVINLLRNAIEALKSIPPARQGREISISARALGGRVILEVADNGPGVSEANQRSLFEAFHTTKAEGMGLGLTISRTIVQAHGGTIEYRDAEPRGARFTIVLPARGSKESARAEDEEEDATAD